MDNLPPPYSEHEKQLPETFTVPSAPLLVHAQPPPVVQQPTITPIITNVSVGNGGRGVGCPVCGNPKNFGGYFPCCAWLCCIFLFPVGIICCLCMRKKKCKNCGFRLK